MFGIMYGDVMCLLFPIILTMFQLQMLEFTGLTSYKGVDLIATWKARAIVMKPTPPLPVPKVSESTA